VVPGDVMNRKRTTPEDFAWAENVIANMQRGNS